MDPAYSKRLLDVLVENASRILNAGFGVDRAESTFFEVLDLLREDAELKGHFLGIVERTLERRDPSGLGEGDVPRELIELAAHELRWPEFKRLAEARLQHLFGGDAMLAISDVAHSIEAACQDDWEDREFYQRYDA